MGAASYIARMFRWISVLVFRLIGWRIEDHRPGDLGSCIYVVAPHTSNWDFLIGVFARSAARLGHVKYLAKASLFKPPYGWIFYALGGYPVDRSRNNKLVPQVVHYFRTIPGFSIAITPEGTRRKVERWKTGFWHIAQEAGVPLILTAMDYGQRRIVFREPFTPTGDKEKDIAWMMDWFRQFKGRNPEQGV